MLGWMPKVAFGDLVEMMVEADLQRLTASEK
jgi:GDP-D-mannose dehydratase